MKLFFIVISICSMLITNAQLGLEAPWMDAIENSELSKLSFDEIVEKGNTFWETHDKDAKGSGYKPFKRWEAYWQNYVDINGYLPSTQDLWKAWKQKTATNQLRTTSENSLTDQSDWFALGPVDFINRSTNYLNLGRVNCIITDPNNSDILYVGTPSGGIWKSVDAGLTYVPLTDQLPQIGVSGIAIDPNNSSIIYIATGDDDAGDSYSVGIWKSTNAGLSWQQTGLDPSNSPYRTSEIYISSNDSNTLWVATSDGVYKTTNAGLSWTLSQSGNFRDLKIKPSDPNTIYATTSSEFYISTNAGDSFTQISSGLPTDSGRLFMDVTEANSDYIYIVSATDNYEYQGIYRSTNSGQSFTQMDNTTDIFESPQAWYDLAIAASNTNANEIYVGVLNIWKSVDGGDSFTQVNSWTTRNDSYTHADIHFIRDLENGLYVGSDGGVFKSTDGGSLFTDLTVGMGITQFYRISVSKQNSNKIAGGAQDNGGFGFNNQWSSYHGGDGMEGVIDPNNDTLYYGFMQTGSTLFVNENSGQPGSTTSYTAPTSGNWITPLSVNKDSEVYAGYSSLYNFNEGNWTEVSPSFETNIDVLELDPINSDIMYVGLNENLQKSTDHGQTFTAINNFPNDITSIEVNNSDNNYVYVTTRGGNGKVYRSSNQGDSFTDITGSLPNVVKNILKHQTNTSANVLYLGTSLGVYRFNDLLNDWEVFDNNLPNCSVTDLSINTEDNNITAATYGRGAWRSELPPSEQVANDLRIIGIENPLPVQINYSTISPQLKVKNNGMNSISLVEVTYSIDEGNDLSFNWSGTIDSQDTAIIELNEIELTRGAHTLSATASIVDDLFSSNNSAEITFYTNDFGIASQVNTFENTTDELIVINQYGNVWQRGIPFGDILNNAASPENVYATNLGGNYGDETEGYLISQYYDLTEIANPILKFDMAFDIEYDWDLVYVQYSVNQGLTWDLLGSADDLNWYNSSRISGDGLSNDCYNCVGGQWTGTESALNEFSYDLNALATETAILFRIVFKSDQSVTGEGVVIDDFYVDGTTLNTDSFELNQLAIYPNPSNNIFFIKLQDNTAYDLKVTDITGKELFAKKQISAGSPFPLQMEGYSSGIYFLKINSNNKQTIRKLILN